ncbi:protein tyrosine phosphatase family protein [Marinobacter sp. JSM 1782161]|uniref:protein tyrosine phosphatase family protein n=1 Tax=Marinobacter sp. JSM 1782161 TaxID=2685906 RepID=UPI0014020E2E|nr:protein tyrosine phosphatase family protein [Marinobacter sp. JSM 1782161]
MSIHDIPNVIPVSTALTTAGQPSEDQLGAAARDGFEVVINLGLLDPRYCLPDEAGLVRRLGMRYVHIPVDFQTPAADDLQRFFDAMDDAGDRKVLVHCAANKRVSSFVALYGEARLGWSRQQADDFLRRIWEPNPNWSAFIERARNDLYL